MAVDLSNALPYLAPALSPDDTAPFHVLGSADDAPVSRTFSRSLIVHYVIDEPGALLYIRERDVSDALLEDLHLCAVDNLRRRAAQRKPRFEVHGATLLAKWDGLNDASLLLLDELWDNRGLIVAAVPARNRLIVAEATTDDALAELKAEMACTSLCTELLGRRDRTWVPL